MSRVLPAAMEGMTMASRAGALPEGGLSAAGLAALAVAAASRRRTIRRAPPAPPDYDTEASINLSEGISR